MDLDLGPRLAELTWIILLQALTQSSLDLKDEFVFVLKQKYQFFEVSQVKSSLRLKNLCALVEGLLQITNQLDAMIDIGYFFLLFVQGLSDLML